MVDDEINRGNRTVAVSSPSRAELSYFRAEPISLASAGFDERWLQATISDDPSILGLGELSVIERERRQGAGGRIDFLMLDPESNLMYEIEVMLGRLNESHIIRTIEYWDIERRVRPNRDHRAVIVAEEITNRFFNVIALFNRAVPIIAIQLNALRVEDNVILDFVKVLDIYELPEEEDVAAGEQTDRGYWLGRAKPTSMDVFDECVSMVESSARSTRSTYNKNHIALGGPRQNFAWFTPRKQQDHCHVRLKVGETGVEDVSQALENIGINVAPYRNDVIRIFLTLRDLKEQRDVLGQVFEEAYDAVNV